MGEIHAAGFQSPGDDAVALPGTALIKAVGGLAASWAACRLVTNDATFLSSFRQCIRTVSFDDASEGLGKTRCAFADAASYGLEGQA